MSTRQNLSRFGGGTRIDISSHSKVGIPVRLTHLPVLFFSRFRWGAEIARPDNEAPHRKGGHRETCFSVRVDGHYKLFMFDSGSIIFLSCSSVLWLFLVLSVLLLATCGRLSWLAFWTIVIDCVID